MPTLIFDELHGYSYAVQGVYGTIVVPVCPSVCHGCIVTKRSVVGEN